MMAIEKIKTAPHHARIDAGSVSGGRGGLMTRRQQVGGLDHSSSGKVADRDDLEVAPITRHWHGIYPLVVLRRRIRRLGGEAFHPPLAREGMLRGLLSFKMAVIPGRVPDTTRS